MSLYSKLARLYTKFSHKGKQEYIYNALYLIKYSHYSSKKQAILASKIALWSEGLIIPESMAQDFGFMAVLGKRAHSQLRNGFSSAVVESKDKSDSGII